MWDTSLYGCVMFVCVCRCIYLAYMCLRSSESYPRHPTDRYAISQESHRNLTGISLYRKQDMCHRCGVIVRSRSAWICDMCDVVLAGDVFTMTDT